MIDDVRVLDGSGDVRGVRIRAIAGRFGGAAPGCWRRSAPRRFRRGVTRSAHVAGAAYERIERRKYGRLRQFACRKFLGVRPNAQ